MKSNIFIRIFFTLLFLPAVFWVGCQQIPSVEDMMSDFQPEPEVEQPRFKRLISEVEILLPFSDTEYGSINYEFQYDEHQRVTSIDVMSVYAGGDTFAGKSEFSYFKDSTQIYTSGEDIYIGQLNGLTRFSFDNDGFVKSYRINGMEYIPEFSYGRLNEYTVENGAVTWLWAATNELIFSRESEWNNGNIIREATYEDGNYVFEITYEYSDYVDKSNLDLLRLAYYLNYYKGLYFMADKSVFKGLSSRNLPSKQVQFTDEETYTFAYQFDEDMYVKEMTVYMDGDLMQLIYVTYQDEEHSGTEDEIVSVKKAVNLPDGSDVIMEGTLVAKTGRGFLFTDNTDVVYVYGGPEWKSDAQVADVVRLSGVMNTYWNNREISLNDVQVIKPGGGMIPEMTPYELTAANKKDFALADHKPCLVHLEGTLDHSVYDYIVLVGDDMVIPSIEFPLVDLAGYLGKEVSLTGYYLWTSEATDGRLYMDIILKQISVIE